MMIKIYPKIYFSKNICLFFNTIRETINLFIILLEIYYNNYEKKTNTFLCEKSFDRSCHYYDYYYIKNFAISS